MSFLYGKMGHNLFQKFCQNHEIKYVNKFYFVINEINYLLFQFFATLLKDKLFYFLAYFMSKKATLFMHKYFHFFYKICVTKKTKQNMHFFTFLVSFSLLK
jgi:hypothetical protein